MKKLTKLKKGDNVAVISPSFAAPGMFPEVYELGLSRLRDVFGLNPIEFPTTRKLGATTQERSKDLIDAFENPEIKAVIATLGGNDQVTYIKNLPREPFINNPKPYLGYSDNTHFMNFLWLNDIPSYYGAAIMTQFAMQHKMNDYSISYIKNALFDEGEFELKPSENYNDIGLDWADKSNLDKQRTYEKNDGFFWDSASNTSGITWGGCLESIDEILRHDIAIPSLEQFNNIILFTETSEEIPSHEYTFRVYRALGERGILGRIQGLLVGRPKAWEFNKPQDFETKRKYREDQRKIIIEVVRKYNKDIPIIQNIDFGHTAPQIPLPYGRTVSINSDDKKITALF